MASFARHSTSTIRMPVELASPTILLRLKCKWSIFIVSHRIVNSVACFRCCVDHSVLCKYFAVVSCCWWIEIRMDYIGQCSNSSSSPTYFVRKMFLLWWNHSFVICAWHTAHTHTHTLETRASTSDGTLHYSSGAKRFVFLSRRSCMGAQAMGACEIIRDKCLTNLVIDKIRPKPPCTRRRIIIFIELINYHRNGSERMGSVWEFHFENGKWKPSKMDAAWTTLIEARCVGTTVTAVVAHAFF